MSDHSQLYHLISLVLLDRFLWNFGFLAFFVASFEWHIRFCSNLKSFPSFFPKNERKKFWGQTHFFLDTLNRIGKCRKFCNTMFLHPLRDCAMDTIHPYWRATHDSCFVFERVCMYALSVIEDSKIIHQTIYTTTHDIKWCQELYSLNIFSPDLFFFSKLF